MWNHEALNKTRFL